ELRETGAAFARANAGEFDRRLAAVKPDDHASLVYTSGTTGTPKGAILTHRNFYSASLAAIKLLNTQDFPRFLAFLPLAHCYGRLAVFWMTIHAGEIAFSSPATLGEDLRTVKPTYIVSVPRLYERMYDQIMLGFAAMPENRQKIVQKATATAKEYGRAISDGGRAPIGLRIRHMIYDRLVYEKLREKLGFEEFVLGTTGSAAIRPELLYFFQGVGVNILEGYGLTETAAPSNVNRPTKFKPGTVGPPFPGMEMTLADDGEILMKGPNIFKGYWNIPAETKEAFTDDGWFRTGDIGVFDDDGYLKIVDRKKELEVLDTGKKIAPISVEQKLMESPYISEGMLVATGQKFAGALIVPNFDNLLRWAKQNGVAFDDKLVVKVKDPTGNEMAVRVGNDLIGDLKVTKLYEAEIAKTNEKCAEYERVKAFRLIPRAFTNPMLPLPLAPGEDYEVTLTLKKKRKLIAKNFQDLIADMFKPRGSEKTK
ncbi:MAG: AMP-dependent synthetase/ligase, partial [Thermoplasmatota archaeon]